MIKLSVWKKSATVLAVAGAVLAFNADALAHGSTKPQHGGIVQMSGETLIELVVQPTGVAIFVKDEDDEVASAGMAAKLVVMHKGARTEIAMKPAAGNKFEARGAKIQPGSKVAVMLTNNTTLAKVSADFAVE